MFGLGKKPQRPNIVANSIVNSIKYSITDKEIPVQRIPHEAEEYFLKNGQTNYAVPNDLIAALPLYWRKYAHKIDYDLLFGEVDEAVEEAIELPEESVNLIRSITLAEIQARGEKEE